MADLIAIRDAIAANITKFTGLRADGQARDQISPPCAVVLPGSPYVTYAVSMDGAMNYNLIVLLIVSDAAPVEKTQRALDALLGAGNSVDVSGSVPMSIEADPQLGGAVDFIQAVTVTSYGRIEFAGQTYFGARINVIAGGQ